MLLGFRWFVSSPAFRRQSLSENRRLKMDLQTGDRLSTKPDRRLETTTDLSRIAAKLR